MAFTGLITGVTCNVSYAAIYMFLLVTSRSAISGALRPPDRVYRTGVEIPELADLIWLFEDEPAAACPDLGWPNGLQAFRLRRGDREVLFSLDPLAGEAYITLYVAGLEVTSIGRLRRLETLSVVRRDSYEGLELRFAGARSEPLSLQTKPGIKLSWDVVSLGTW